MCRGAGAARLHACELLFKMIRAPVIQFSKSLTHQLLLHMTVVSLTLPQLVIVLGKMVLDEA